MDPVERALERSREEAELMSAHASKEKIAKKECLKEINEILSKHAKRSRKFRLKLNHNEQIVISTFRQESHDGIFIRYKTGWFPLYIIDIRTHLGELSGVELLRADKYGERDNSYDNSLGVSGKSVDEFIYELARRYANLFT